MCFLQASRKPQSDTGGEVPKNDERGDVECVGARFIAPAGWGWANALHLATSIQSGQEPVIGQTTPVLLYSIGITEV